MKKEDRLAKIVSDFNEQMKSITQSQKFAESAELRAWYETRLNETIEAFRDYEPMFDALIEAGYPDRYAYPSFTHFINANRPFPDDFVAVVMKYLPKMKFKLGAVELLRNAEHRYDGRVLIPIFSEADANGKWRLCDAIVQNPPLFIDEWVLDIFFDKRYSYSETGLLPLAIIKLFPADRAREILKMGFDLHYRVTPEALGKVGRLEDIPFLESKLLQEYTASHVKKDIQLAIRKIMKRHK